MVFDCLHLDFSDGINVFIGENSTGKTSLLKMIYATTQWSIENADINKTRKLPNFFSLDKEKVSRLSFFHCIKKVMRFIANRLTSFQI